MCACGADTCRPFLGTHDLSDASGTVGQAVSRSLERHYARLSAALTGGTFQLQADHAPPGSAGCTAGTRLMLSLCARRANGCTARERVWSCDTPVDQGPALGRARGRAQQLLRQPQLQADVIAARLCPQESRPGGPLGVVSAPWGCPAR